MGRFMMVAAGAVLCAGAAVAAGLTPAELKCEYRTDPMGIDVTVPRLTWILTGDGRGLAQTAYQIVASSSPEALAKDQGDLWDSGKVASDESVLIPWAGAPLTSRTVCHWKVRVWDQDGKPSAWSAPARFSMGLLTPADWTAEWIGYDGALPGDEELLREPMKGASWIWFPEGVPAKDIPACKRWFRKEFTLPKDDPMVKAVLYASADNGAKVSFNGKRAGKGKDPIQGYKRCYEYDVTDLLAPGANVMGVEGQNNAGNAGFIATLEVALKSGALFALNTDGSWKCLKDRPEKGWDTAKFKGRGWVDAEAVAPYGAKPWGKPLGEALYLPPPPQLRHEFAVDKPVRRATVHASAFGIYEMRINGARVGDALFTPGWTDYSKRVYYNTYDVTALLKPGAPNAAAVILADGWYAGHVGLKGRNVYGESPRVLAQLEIEYEDGTTARVVTDGSWKAAYGEIREADLLMGETRDFAKATPGWELAGFDDSTWFPAEVTPRAEVTVPVQAHPGNPVRRMETFAAQKMTEPKPGVFVYDLGQNMVGWAKVAVEGKAGDTVVLRFAEMLQPEDGMLYTIALRAARATDTFRLAADGRAVLEPGFTFHGFRYVEVSGVKTPPALSDVTGVVMNSEIPQTARFEASSPLLTQLAHNIVWGQKGNYLEAPTDCPQRDERLGWTGDAQFFMPTALYTADIGAFHTKWLVDLIEDGQLADGSFPHVAPDVLNEGGAVAWGDAAFICPYLMHRFYGDTRVIERHYANMVRGMEYLEKTSREFIRRDLGFGDWLNLGGGAKDEVICTAYYAYLARLMSEMAGIIGRTDDAARYTALHENIRNAFIKAFVGPDGKILESSQTGYALAFAFDLIPEELRAAAAEQFAAEIARFDNHLATGFIGTPRLLPSLVRAGRSDLAYTLLMNETFPSWLYQVKLGSTTMWERWNGWSPEKGFADPGMNSFNHYAFGAVGEFMYTDVAGIQPGADGFKKIIIRPRPGGGLSSAKLAYRSIRGEVVSDWKIENGRSRVAVAVPANTTAVVCLPTASAEGVIEGGAPVAAAKGLTNPRVEEGEFRCDAASGGYVFEAPYTAAK